MLLRLPYADCDAIAAIQEQDVKTLLNSDAGNPLSCKISEAIICEIIRLTTPQVSRVQIHCKHCCGIVDALDRDLVVSYLDSPYD
jgi:hypothetical protein